MIYPTISLWQWWASAIAWGEKQYETRSWPTNYRGLIAIHATKRQPSWMDVPNTANKFVTDMLRRHDTTLEKLPLGAVLCICELEAVYHIQAVRPYISEKERAFGDYSDERAAWKLRVVHVYDQPIPKVGKQKIWQCELPEVKVS